MHRVLISLTDDEMQKVDAHWHAMRLKSRSAAIRALLDRALAEIQGTGARVDET